MTMDLKGQGRAAIVLVLLAGLIFALYRWTDPSVQPLPEFSAIEDVEQRKAAFFGYLAPLVAAENRRILGQRERLTNLIDQIEAGQALAPLSRHWLEELAREYELQWPGSSPEATAAELLERVDALPIGLALVQAAKESGWGQSRFARQGNNLFGQWCYEPGCGIVPTRRLTDASHEVAAFDSARASVRRYLNNLNSHESYRPLRARRRAARQSGTTASALELAEELVLYSERREAYVEDIKAMLHANHSLIRAAQGAVAGSAKTTLETGT